MNLEGLTEKWTNNPVKKYKVKYFENENGEMVAKVCTNCGKPRSLGEFTKDKSKLGGRRSICKECINVGHISYQRKISVGTFAGLTERKTKYGTLFYENEDGEITQKACTTCHSIKEVDEFRLNKNKLGGREGICKTCGSKKDKAWYTANKKHKAKVTAVWYEINKEKCSLRYARWARKNKERLAIKEQKRRARKKYLPDTLTYAEYTKTLTHFGNACALTGRTDNLEQEHAIPQSIGGGFTFENIYPMTKSLNCSKFNYNIFEWFEANRQRFNLSQERFDRLIEWLGKANGMTVKEYRDYVYWCHANPRNINEEVDE